MGILSDVSPIALVSLVILLFEHCTTVTLTRYTQQRVDAPRPSPVRDQRHMDSGLNGHTAHT